MLNKGGFRTILGGNIGNALTEELNKLKVKSAKLKVDFIVAEVSSFQLEAIEMFRPDGASILNITPDHMDRYHSMKKYKDAKAQIFANQKEGDFLVLNADDIETMRLYDSRFNPETYSGQDSRLPDVYFFSRKKEVNGIYYKDGIVYCNLAPMTGQSRFYRLR